MRVAVLGPLEVFVDGRAVAVAAPKQRALLAVLVAAEGAPVAADRLVEQLWPEAAPPTATAALQVHVSALRKVFGPVLRTVPAGYLLDLPETAVDARVFTAGVAAARTRHADDPRDAADRLAAALALWRGPAFDGVPEGPAVRAAAARLEHLRAAALEEWADTELRLGRPDPVVAALGPVVAARPSAERLTARLMLALSRTGRAAEALAAFAGLRAALHAIGTRPDAETAALAAAVARRDPTLQPAVGALPTPAGRFVGRRRDRDRLADLLGRCRLLTLCGPGGSGKTRLAFEVAREAAAAHPDGVHLVELAGIGDGEAIPGRVAAAFGVRERPGEPVADTLRDRLAGGRPLLLVDNCEHLLGAVAELVARLLRDSAGLRVLATSREPLGVAGETVWTVAGLAVPAAGAPVAELARSDAVRLLVERATAARPTLRMTAADTATAAAVCRRLDGLPLAIELVAAQLRGLSLSELARRLDQPFALLATRTGTARHRSLRAAIDWSYRLLDPAERVLLRRLSVFAAGGTLAAAARVGADPSGPPPTDPERVLAHLTALVDRSMVVAQPGEPESRFAMLQTLQAYCADLDGGPTALRGARDRHLAWYRDLVTQAPPLGGDAHERWLRTFDVEHDNLLAALRHGVAHDPAAALSIAAGLWWYWWSTGQMAEGRTWLARALDAGRDAPDTARAPALRAAASLARNSGDHPTARAHGEASLRLYTRLGDDAGIAAALNGLCMTSQAQGDLDASLRFGRRSEALARRTGNPRGIAAAVNNVGCTLRVLGRLDEAQERFAEALTRFRDIADRRGEAAVHTNLAIVARRRGDHPTSRRHCRESLALYRELDLPEGQLDMLDGLACLELAAGRPAQALHLLLVADRERARLGAPLFTPDEIADRTAALAGARDLLDAPAQEKIAAEAAHAALDLVVGDLLADG